jgi:SAM-dependent methyltransferase/uncharacterized coiled-coil protein SlyX
MSGSDKRQTTFDRIASAIRRSRALLSTPERLNKFDLQIRHISGRLDELSAGIEADLGTVQKVLTAEFRNELSAAIAHSVSDKVRVLSEDLRSELSAQLAFSFYDEAESVSLAQAEARHLITDLKAHFGSQITDLAKICSDMHDHLSRLNSELTARINGIETFQSESRNAVAGLSTSQDSRMNGLETFQLESRNIVTDLNTSLNSRMNGLETNQFESKNTLVELNTSLNSRMNGLETFQLESRNMLGELNTSLNSRINSLETFQSEIRNELGSLNASVNSRMNNLETFQSSMKTLLSEIGTGIESRINSLEALQFELKNLVIHIGTSVDSRLNGIDTLQSETNNFLQHVHTSVETRLNSFEFEKLPAIHNQMHELIAAQFSLSAGSGVNEAQLSAHPNEQYRPAKNNRWAANLARAEHDFRNVYPFWKQRLDTMLKEFRKTKVGNAAWAGDVKSRLFRGFVNRYAHGRVLDVGCGIFGRPYYLASYSSELISGLDPLQPEEKPDFEFVRGLSEYLPWPDGSFSTVISATALDHCLSLDGSLSEIKRVLRQKGCFLLWIDSMPGAPEYEPNSIEFVPSDQNHLFHFDVAWFEPMLLKAFEIVDRIELQRTGYISVMYCLERGSGRILSAGR